MTRGVCLGWSIRSDLEFHFLRPGMGWKELQVSEWEPGRSPAEGSELLVRWRARPDRPFHGSVHKGGGGELVVETSDAGWFRIHPEDAVVQVPTGVDPVARETRLWTTPMLLLTTLEGLTPLHAACIDVGGRAIAISAPGGFGKTTLAAGLVGRGHGLLAEDVAVVDEEFNAIPGPDLLRLRPPSMSALELGKSLEVVSRTDNRVFMKTGSPISVPLPLAAVVFLKVAGNRALVRRSDPQRVADLWQVSFHLPNLTDRTRAFGAVASVADRVPIYDLNRPLDWDSIEWSMDAVEEIANVGTG